MFTVVTILVFFVISSSRCRQQTPYSSHGEFNPSRDNFTPSDYLSVDKKQAWSRKHICPSASLQVFACLLQCFNLHHAPQRLTDVRRTLKLENAGRLHQSIMKGLTGTEGDSNTDAPLLQLLEERRLGMLIKRASNDPNSVLELIQDAGVAGVVAVVIVYPLFYLLAALIGEIVYHTTSGQWLDPTVLIQEDTTGKAEALALIGAWFLVCKSLTPVKFAIALLFTPKVKRLMDLTAPTVNRSVQEANFTAASHASQELTSRSSQGEVVECLVHPRTGQCVTLIGTMHLSAASNAQVAHELRSLQPDVVVLELDPERLPRLGISDADFAVPYRTSEGIMPPLGEDDIADAEHKAAGDGWWWRPVRAKAIDAIARTARLLISSMYKNVGADLGGGLKPGGEFVEAILAAKELGVPCVLADRESVETLTRLAELVLRSGNATSLVDTMANISEETYTQVKVSMGGSTNDVDDESILAVMEEVKRSAEFREQFVARLSAEVPAFARAFIDERDYIMAKAIHRELENPGCAKHVCAVIGAGHLNGLKRNLEDMWSQAVAG